MPRFGLEFVVEGQVQQLNLPKQVSVNSADGYMAACEAGYGLVLAPQRLRPLNDLRWRSLG